MLLLVNTTSRKISAFGIGIYYFPQKTIHRNWVASEIIRAILFQGELSFSGQFDKVSFLRFLGQSSFRNDDGTSQEAEFDQDISWSREYEKRLPNGHLGATS
jgi:hypothetical protein